MENPLDPGYFCSDDLRRFGFRRVGEGVRISRNCVIVGPENIEIGDNVQIDSFTSIIVKSGWLKLGSYIHVGTSVLLGCRGGIEVGNFTGISHGAKLLSCSDDFSGDWLLSTCVPPEYTNRDIRPILVSDHAIVAAQAVVLPGVTIEEGAILGAHGLTARSLDPWTIYGGVPAKPLRQRERRVSELGALVLARALAVE